MLLFAILSANNILFLWGKFKLIELEDSRYDLDSSSVASGMDYQETTNCMPGYPCEGREGTSWIDE